MPRIVVAALALAASLATDRTAEASCQGPTEYALPLHGQVGVPPGCVIDLVVAAADVQFDPALLVVRRVDGDTTVSLDHTLESQLSDAVIHTDHTVCDPDTCEDVETEGFSFPVDRHRLLVAGGLPPDAAIEVVTDDGSLLAAFTTALDDASATGTCLAPDAFDLAPPDCNESCDVAWDCVGDGPPESGGCAMASTGSGAAWLLLLLGALRRRR